MIVQRAGVQAIKGNTMPALLLPSSRRATFLPDLIVHVAIMLRVLDQHLMFRATLGDSARKVRSSPATETIQQKVSVFLRRRRCQLTDNLFGQLAS